MVMKSATLLQPAMVVLVLYFQLAVVSALLVLPLVRLPIAVTVSFKPLNNATLLLLVVASPMVVLVLLFLLLVENFVLVAVLPVRCSIVVMV
jgi:hypothetical protein